MAEVISGRTVFGKLTIVVFFFHYFYHFSSYLPSLELAINQESDPDDRKVNVDQPANWTYDFYTTPYPKQFHNLSLRRNVARCVWGFLIFRKMIKTHLQSN